ncbi:hypothetical protein Tco_0528755 [Tanacetum coccineum]
MVSTAALPKVNVRRTSFAPVRPHHQLERVLVHLLLSGLFASIIVDSQDDPVRFDGLVWELVVVTTPRLDMFSCETGGGGRRSLGQNLNARLCLDSS